MEQSVCDIGYVFLILFLPFIFRNDESESFVPDYEEATTETATQVILSFRTRTVRDENPGPRFD